MRAGPEVAAGMLPVEVPQDQQQDGRDDVPGDELQVVEGVVVVEDGLADMPPAGQQKDMVGWAALAPDGRARGGTG